MAIYAYLANAAKIRTFLAKIQEAGTPNKLSYQELKKLGFTSSNDRRLIGVMKAIGFVDSNGIPTDRWQEYRNRRRAGAVLAQGIKEHYSDLFKTYPNAHLKDIEALNNFFSANTRVGAGTLDFMIRTFKTLCELADFEVDVEAMPRTTDSKFEIGQKVEEHLTQTNAHGYTVNINIQLSLPSDAKKETFDEFFKSMKKHLID